MLPLVGSIAICYDKREEFSSEFNDYLVDWSDMFQLFLCKSVRKMSVLWNLNNEYTRLHLNICHRIRAPFSPFLTFLFARAYFIQSEQIFGTYDVLFMLENHMCSPFVAATSVVFFHCILYWNFHFIMMSCKCLSID